MVEPQIQDLLEAGVHFGHQSSRWNPKMKRYIFAARNGIHIIDLQKTLKALEEAKAATRAVTLDGNRVLFVCTKRQLRPIIEAEADAFGELHVRHPPVGLQQAEDLTFCGVEFHPRLRVSRILRILG